MEPEQWAEESRTWYKERESAAGCWDPLSPLLHVPGMGQHGQGVPYTSVSFKPPTATQGNNKALTFPPHP